MANVWLNAPLELIQCLNKELLYASNVDNKAAVLVTIKHA